METSFSPPIAVQVAARRGLEMRREAPPHKKGGTLVGIMRARDLANGKKIPITTILRMASFFARHQGNQNKDPDEKYDRGQISWLLWGGDPGRKWAESIIENWRKEIKNKKGFTT
jgi:hypothetical protein